MLKMNNSHFTTIVVDQLHILIKVRNSIQTEKKIIPEEDPKYNRRNHTLVFVSPGFHQLMREIF